MLQVTLSILLVILALVAVTKFKKKQSTIPSPPEHFLLGHLLTFFELDPRPMLAFNQLTEKYGNLVSLNLLKVEMIIMSGYDDLKSFLSSQKSEMRAHSPLARGLVYGTEKRNVGILFNGEPDFRELRRFTLRCFRDLGVGKTKSEEIVLEEARNLVLEIGRLRELGDGLITGDDLDLVFKKTALNVVWNFCGGKRFPYDDMRMSKLLHFLDSFVMLGKEVLGKPLGALPFLKYVPPYRAKYRKTQEGLQHLRDFITESIEEHEDSLEAGSPRDLIDMFLIEARETQHKTFTRENLVAICADLFLAGSETTAKVMQIFL